MGTLPVPTEFPISLASVSTSHNPIPRDSCSTPNFFLFTPLDPSATQLYPSYLPFGDNLSLVKAESSFRISFCNIGGFLALGFSNPKVSEIKTFLASYNLNVFGSCKANLNWYGLPDHLQLKEWFRMAVKLSRLITVMKTVVNTSLAACSGLLPDMLLSIFPLAKNIPPIWVAGSPVLFLVGWANICTLSLHTVPVPIPHPDCTASMLNIASILCNSLAISIPARHFWMICVVFSCNGTLLGTLFYYLQT